MGTDHRTTVTHFMRRHFYIYPTEEKPHPQGTRINMQNLDYKILFISVCVWNLSIHCEGRPLRKRTVSEVQFMHNLGEHKQVQERREWLQMRLRGIHTAAGRDGSGEEVTAGGQKRRRKLGAEELRLLKDLSPEEIQLALNLLEKLLKSKKS